MIGRSHEALAATSPADPVLEGLTPRTAVVHILFCALLCVAVVLARTL